MAPKKKVVKTKKSAAAGVGAAVRAQADKAIEAIGHEVDARVRGQAVKAAKSVLALNRRTVDNTFKMLAKLEKQSEKVVKDAVGKLPWLPKDGKAAINAWLKTLEKGRKDFKKTIDEGLDSLSDYVDGLDKGAAKTAAKAAPKKKAPAKKKAVVKKAAAKKAAPAEAAAE